MPTIHDPQDNQKVAVAAPSTTRPDRIAYDSDAYSQAPISNEVSGQSLYDYLDIVYRRKWWMLITFAAILTIGCLSTFTLPRLYSSTAEIIVAPPTQGGPGTSGIQILDSLKGLTMSRSAATQVKVLRSRDLIDTAFANLPEKERLEGFGAKAPKPDIRSAKDTDVIVISVTAETPEAAAAMANSVVKTYEEQDLHQSREATLEATQYIQGELKRVGSELYAARRILAKYKLRTGMYVVDTTLQQRVEYVSKLDEEAMTVARDQAQIEQTLASLAPTLAKTDLEIVSGTTEQSDPVKGEIEARIEQLEARRTELLQTYVPASPEINAVGSQIKGARQRLTAHLNAQISSRQTSINPIHQDLQRKYLDARIDADVLRVRAIALHRQLSTLKDAMKKLPEQELQVTELINTVKQLEMTYAMLSDKYQTLRISEEASLTTVKVVSVARVEPVPISPKIPQNIALFFMLGLLASIGIAMVLEALDDRIHSSETLERLSGRPVLAQVPMVTNDCPQLLGTIGAHSTVLEAIRLLRGNLTFANMDSSLRVLAVSSTRPGEGKSTTAINLAIAMAMDGKRVIIVDCDLRRPSLHTYFGLSREVGITNVATGQVPLDRAIQQTLIDGVSLLATGPLPPNPPEVLNALGTRAVIRTLAEQYDMVIIDTPPTSYLSDVPVISTMVDGLLLVVTADETHRGQIQMALRALDHVEAPLLGFVYNKVSSTHTRYGYYYYYAEDDALEEMKKRQGRRRQHHSVALTSHEATKTDGTDLTDRS